MPLGISNCFPTSPESRRPANLSLFPTYLEDPDLVEPNLLDSNYVE